MTKDEGAELRAEETAVVDKERLGYLGPDWFGERKTSDEIVQEACDKLKADLETQFQQVETALRRYPSPESEA